jgi:hypothetical protein
MTSLIHPSYLIGVRSLSVLALVSTLVGCAQMADTPAASRTQATAPTATATAPVACAELATALPQQIANLRILGAEVVAEGLTISGMATPAPRMPAHCRVFGVLNERKGVDDLPYGLGFEMRLPSNWNQRFLVQANGGSDGVVVPAFGNVVSNGATTNGLLQGFAVLSTDAGHRMVPAQQAQLVGGVLFGLDPQARLDYGYQAKQTLVPVAKRIVAIHYGQAATRSYMLGCSNGGRHGMVAAARLAHEFDGIVAGNPGFNLPKAAVQHAWDIQALSRVNPDVKEALSPGDMRLVAGSVLRACDALDGVADGAVDNHRACQRVFKLDPLQCTGAKTDACLSAVQVSALKDMFAGPRNSAGERLYADWPWDAGVGASAIGFGSWRSWKLEGPVAGLPIIGALGAGSLAYVFSTPPQRLTGSPSALMESLRVFNFDTDAPRIFATDQTFRESAMEFMTPPDATGLRAFARKGAKLMVYHGVSDPVFSVNDTINWWEALNQRHGGRAADFARLYTIPGHNHCQGGPSTDQFDMLSAVVNWVEKGQAPDRVMATARVGANADVPGNWVTADGKPRTRPLCPYPQQARYSGSGDINDGQNFVCRNP